MYMCACAYVRTYMYMYVRNDKINARAIDNIHERIRYPDVT